MEYKANPKFPAIPSSGGTQGVRFTAHGYGDTAVFQSWNEGTMSLIFFGTNRLYNGSTWSSLNSRAAYMLQLQDTGFYLYNFAAGSNLFTIRLNLDSSGNLFLPTGYLSIQANQVLSARKTGWGTPTGTLSRTALNTGTATVTNVAQTLGALITDLISHGLIGA